MEQPPARPTSLLARWKFEENLCIALLLLWRREAKLPRRGPQPPPQVRLAEDLPNQLISLQGLIPGTNYPADAVVRITIMPWCTCSAPRSSRAEAVRALQTYAMAHRYLFNELIFKICTWFKVTASNWCNSQSPNVSIRINKWQHRGIDLRMILPS